MSEIDKVQVDDAQAATVAQQIKTLAETLEQNLADLESKVSAVEARSNADFIQTYKQCIEEFRNQGGAEAVAGIKTAAGTTEAVARAQAAEAQRNIEI